MEKPVNLAEMLWHQATAAESKAPAAAAQARSASKLAAPRSGFADGFPGPSNTQVSSFQDKVQASRAKLESRARAQTPKVNTVPRNANAAAANAEARGRADAARNQRAQADGQARAEKTPVQAPKRNTQADSQTSEQDAASARQGQADKSRMARTARLHAAQRPRGLDADSDNGQPDAASQTAPNDPQADANAQAASGNDAGQSAVDTKTLQTALKRLGIDATDQQLNDPAFLKQVLAMLQNMGAQATAAPVADAKPQGDAPSQAAGALAPAQSQPDALPAAPADGTADPIAQARAQVTSALLKDASGKQPGADAAQAGPADAQAASDGPKPDLRQLEALLKDKLSALAKDPGQDQVQVNGPARPVLDARAPVPGPDANAHAFDIAAVPRGREAARPEIDASPLLDQDRLRVLQTAGTHLDKQARDIAVAGDKPAAALGNTDVTSDGETGGPAITALSAADSESPEDKGGNALLGKDASQGSAAAAPKDGAQGPKEAGPTFFQQAFEQIRGTDRVDGAAEPKGWMPQHASVPDQAVLSQIAHKLSALGSRSGDEIQIQLEPEHLGKVRISLEMKDDGLTARIGVENDEVRKVVDANLGNLRDTLENQGIKLQGLEVSVDQRHASLFNPDGSNAQEFFHRRGGSAPGGAQAGGDDAQIDLAPESDTGRRWGYNTMEYIA